MKDCLAHNLKQYPTVFRKEVEVLSHLFCTLGNGVTLKELNQFKFKTPIEIQPLEHIYKFSFNEEFQPFRKYIGCEAPGFEAAVLWFIDCIKATPDTVKNIEMWKRNTDLIKMVLK